MLYFIYKVNEQLDHELQIDHNLTGYHIVYDNLEMSY
jgi:hypothetical protein